MIAYLFSHTWRERVLRSRARLALLIVYALLALWSGLDGLSWKKELAQLQAERPGELRQSREEWMKELEDIEAGQSDSPYKGRPMNLSLPAVLPPGPMAVLAHRGESIHPHTTVLSGWRSEASLFRRYEVEGPNAMALRGLDLSYLATIVFPLALLLLSFDALSAERESGRLKLLTVQGLRPGQLLLARLLAVGVPLWAITVVVAWAVGLGDAGGAGSGRLLLWTALFSAYALLWAGVAGLCASLFKRGADAAMGALGLWIAGVLLLPSGVQFAATALYPVPSQVAYLSEARVAEANARRETQHHAEMYMVEHEVRDASKGSKVPDYFRRSFVANAHVRAETAKIMRGFEEGRRNQAQVVNGLEFLVPTVLTHRSMQRVAGVGGERAADFRQQARIHLQRLQDAIGPATVAKTRLSSAQARKMPDFRFREASIGGGFWLRLLWLSFLALLAGLLARRIASRVNPLES